MNRNLYNEWIKAAFKLQFKSFKKTYVAIFEVIENIDKFHILSQNTIQSLIVVWRYNKICILFEEWP